ncbi:MAG: hypothetical protein PHQ32_06720 [Firmicutes bacterium]|nr:hypothetical protein [Bacillota bacterium]
MKRLFLVLFVMLLVMTGCAGNKADSDSIGVEEKIFSVDINIPASMYEDGEALENVNEIKGQEGVLDAVVNADGSVTMKVTKAQHAKMMEEMQSGILEYIEEIKTSTDFKSVVDLDYNKDFSKFTLEVRQNDFENSFDGFVVLGLGMYGMLYQIYDGTPSDNAEVVIEVKSTETGKVFDSYIYPDALEDMADFTN